MPAHEAGAEVKRRLLDKVVRDLRNQENRNPVAREGADEPEGRPEDGHVIVVQEQRLPHINAVGKNADMHNGTGVEHATYR